MTTEEYELLYEKYLSGTCTTDEIKLLQAYRDQFKMVVSTGKLLPEEREIKNRVYQRISETVFAKPARVVNLILLRSIAAVIAVGICIGVFFIKPRQQQIIANNIKVKAKPIIPGRNTAVLTLADGSTIQLDAASNGVLLTNGKATIKKVKSGELVYKAINSPEPATSVAMNTMSVPRGGQYHLVLSDGTQVWLNSVSSLTYPTNFTGSERVVKLVGEAYFEVAHNEKMPFKVMTNNADIEVLGTHFNISAYEGEPYVKTTLLEGSVNLSNKNSVVTLMPGQQGITTGDAEKINVKNVKVAEVIAWKNGSFVFRHANILDIMKQVSRWYDVDIEYRGNVKDQYFGGTYSKYKDITELLKGLELTGLIHFKIEGRRIIAMP